ncbi:MAG: NADPH-dependent F420 reductase [Solirubrobacterales bacterium]
MARIGVIGSGSIGATAARLFAEAGHEIAIANSRGPASLSNLVAALGPSVRATDVAGAASFGELVLVAIPLHAYRNLPAEAMAGKIVIDAMNYYAGRDGRIEALEEDAIGSSELLAGHLRGARVVKAFNTMYFETLARGAGGEAGGRLVLFLAGDDAEAKRAVAELIEEIGFEPVDTGSLSEGGRRQEPGSPIYNRPMRREEAERALAELG